MKAATGIGIAAGAGGLMLAGIGIADDSHTRMLREAAEAAGGDLLVHGDGYWDSRASDIGIQDGGAGLERVRGVAGAATVSTNRSLI